MHPIKKEAEGRKLSQSQQRNSVEKKVEEIKKVTQVRTRREWWYRRYNYY